MAAPRRGGDGELDGRFLETEVLAPPHRLDGIIRDGKALVGRRGD
jgi:hypothetical protein